MRSRESDSLIDGPMLASLGLVMLVGLALVAATMWSTGGDSASFDGPAAAEPAAAEIDTKDRAHRRARVSTPDDSQLGQPELRLIMTAVAEDREMSTATVYTEALRETSVVHPGQVVPTADEVLTREGVVETDHTETILQSVGSGWARFEHGEEQWTVGITAEPPSSEPDPKRNDFLPDASFAPRFGDNGDIDGVFVTSVEADGMYARLGLVEGDVLLAINDIELNDTNATKGAFEALEASTSLRISLERNGEAESVDIQRAAPR